MCLPVRRWVKCACVWVCVRVWEPIYQHVLRTYVCSNNYAAMYNLVCYLNSTSTVHWFLSLCLQLHTECNGCSNYRLLVFCPQHTYKCKDLSTYYYSNKQLLCFPFTGGFKCVPLKNALIVHTWVILGVLSYIRKSRFFNGWFTSYFTNVELQYHI